jgi:hypothetical protein
MLARKTSPIADVKHVMPPSSGVVEGDVVPVVVAVTVPVEVNVVDFDGVVDADVVSVVVGLVCSHSSKLPSAKDAIAWFRATMGVSHPEIKI